MFLGEHAWLQDQAELQLTARPGWHRDHWEMGAAAEYGLTSRVQLSLEGTWMDGPHMDVFRELELGARFAALRSERWALAIGGSAAAELTGSDMQMDFVPLVSLSFAGGPVGANLAVSSALADGIEPAIAVALFARVGSLIPLVEAGVRDGEVIA